MMIKLYEILKKYWGYDNFLPLQKEAIECVLNNRDSVVVLPTGGGKSLCFQSPAMCMEGMAVVVSPLISLMKDQVDTLNNCGVPAAFINSSLSVEEKRVVANAVFQGRIKLLYVAPERLILDSFMTFLKQVQISFFAIDEAHCISMWGHDFRPEYRKLSILKSAFPGTSIHAFTATATKQVQDDIVQGLKLDDPEVIIGSFDRSNLSYSVVPRDDRLKQVCSIIDEHKNESGIIYCIRRADVDELCEELLEKGYKALPYHAGLSDTERKSNQDAFIRDEADIIVATIAFGMGIDKSNIRYIIHAGMPKSLENYQQETGRAGRDGLKADCHLFFSGSDFAIWKFILSNSDADVTNAGLKKLSDMYNFCINSMCRHKAIVTYFGQEFDKESCEACDICLNEVEQLEDSLIVSQKILSCVARLKGRFGAVHVVRVLAGSKEKRILKFGHDKQSTWGLLSHESRKSIRSWIEQLIAQRYLQRTGEYNAISLTEKGWLVFKGEETPNLLKTVEKADKQSRKDAKAWDGVDINLFDILKSLRREKADEQGVPAFVVFSDASLRDMARKRPTTLKGFLKITGVGQKKCATYGKDFVKAISDYCDNNDIETNIQLKRKRRKVNTAKLKAFELFEQDISIPEVAESVDRALSTVSNYLEEYIKNEGIDDPSPWVDAETDEKILEAAEEVGMERLKPIFEFLNGKIDYSLIRISLACFRNRSNV
ncbi:DNA helicase RecQ [Candidatus Poribacteria bacterium]|nr:DNA helicase RecQ [Candidatus Poribacteria bacterium]